METFIVTGNYTASAMKGMIDSPSDRLASVTSLMESIGGKLISYYLTTGDNDFLIILEAQKGSDVIASLLVVGATGTVANLKTVQAFSSAEFEASQKRAGEIVNRFKSAAS